ncbi:hypothetical protein HN51_043059 [Arachis hypogaea]
MAILQELLQEYINSLFVEGLVNDQFLSLKNTEELDCVVQIIDKYFEYVDMILPELSCQFDNSKVDFSKLASLVREIEEKSTRPQPIAASNIGGGGATIFNIMEALGEKVWGDRKTAHSGGGGGSEQRREAFTGDGAVAAGIEQPLSGVVKHRAVSCTAE